MKNTTQNLMIQVLLALLPGIITLTWFLGPGVLINLFVAIVVALIAEFILLSLRDASTSGQHSGASIKSQLTDGSAIVTASLIAVCLPPYLSIWLVAAGVLFAIIFGKHIYGGLGHNVFNPAMVGFALLILSFPLAMSQWPVIDSTGPDIAVLIQIKLGLMSVPDGITAATPLDIVKFRGSQTIDEVWLPKYGFNSLAGVGWGWISVAFLLGGLYLLKNRVIQYHAPASLLLTLTLLSIFFYDSGSSDSLGSPLLHLLSCSTMFAAFFIVTDPVSSPSGAAGQIIFGAGVGIITFIIRTAGAYPEGIAFAILLMNAAAPLIDRLRLAPPALSSLTGRGKSE